MTNSAITSRIVRYGELKPCKTAFIDAHTPGSDQKENFTIIGGGVSESPDQHVHITDKIGFNIGAASQPPKCRNSLHSHTTAEVFLSPKAVGGFSGGAMAMLVSSSLRREIFSTFLAAYSAVLKMSAKTTE